MSKSYERGGQPPGRDRRQHRCHAEGWLCPGRSVCAAGGVLDRTLFPTAGGCGTGRCAKNIPVTRAVEEFLEMNRYEEALYDRYKALYGYVFYIGKKR